MGKLQKELKEDWLSYSTIIGGIYVGYSQSYQLIYFSLVVLLGLILAVLDRSTNRYTHPKNLMKETCGLFLISTFAWAIGGSLR